MVLIYYLRVVYTVLGINNILQPQPQIQVVRTVTKAERVFNASFGYQEVGFKSIHHNSSFVNIHDIHPKKEFGPILSTNHRD